MDIPYPGEGDVDIGIGIFKACWVLTGIVAIVLIFRLVVKAWVYWALPDVASPERVWGIEDALFVISYACEVAHMCFVQKSANHGLGRHFYYLTFEERNQSMKWDFASQPLAVAASMISRTGMMWFLYQCFGINNTKTKRILIACMVIQIVVNSFTILQIVLQCGPNPYRLVDRTKYFHYMWDPLPTDGSVVCQDPSVQATVGFVQGAFNTVIDFSLAYLAAYELWQIIFRTKTHNSSTVMKRFRTLDRTIRSRRIWQTLSLSGPLVLSGAASIVKTYLLKALGDRLDFTHNIPEFILWVKIENYSILIATCAPVARLFFRIILDGRRGVGPYASHSRSNQDALAQKGGLGSKSKSKSKSNSTSVHYSTQDGTFDRLGSDLELASVGSEDRIIKEGNRQDIKGIQVKSDIVVRIEDNSLEEERMDRDRAGTRRNPNTWTRANVRGGEV